MVFVFMFSWWYSRGWGYALRRISIELSKISKVFAVSILLKTLFSPWKQISSVSNFQNFFQVLLDNTLSRTIGFLIRFFILIVALLWAAVVTTFGLVFLILWPVIPLLVILLPVLYFRGVTL